MSSLKRLPVFASLILVVLFLSACAAPTAALPETQEEATEAVAAGEEPAAEGPASLQVTDALGRKVTFEKPPSRIVVAGRASSLVANALYLFPEGKQRMAALEARYQSPASEAFLPLVDPSFNQKTELQENASAEQIAPVRPDLVVLKSYMMEKLGDPLEQLGIPVVTVDLENPEQFYRDIQVMGEFLGSSKRAEEIVSYYQQRVDRVKKLMDGLPEADKPRVLLLQYTSKGGEVAFNVPPQGWLQTQMVEFAGGAPVWTEAAGSGGWIVVTFEQIAAWNPDQVYLVSYAGDAGKVVENLKSDPQWQALRAVQDGKLYAFPGDFYSWDQPDTRWILGLSWLATKIQPERASSLDMMQEVEGFYSELYGLDEAAIDEKVLTVLNGDIP